MATNTAAIASTTSAATAAADIAVDSGASIQIWTAPALADGETVSVFRVSSSSPEDVVRVYEGERPLQVKLGGSIMVNGPGTFRLVKSATATATTVYYDS